MVQRNMIRVLFPRIQSQMALPWQTTRYIGLKLDIPNNPKPLLKKNKLVRNSKLSSVGYFWEYPECDIPWDAEKKTWNCKLGKPEVFPKHKTDNALPGLSRVFYYIYLVKL